MVNNFMLIEDGSVDTKELRKILDDCGNTDVKLIIYRQGAAKPELVSIEKDAALATEEIKQQTTQKIFDALSKFLDARTEGATTAMSDYCSYKTEVTHKTTYKGTVGDFMREFEEFLRNYEG